MALDISMEHWGMKGMHVSERIGNIHSHTQAHFHRKWMLAAEETREITVRCELHNECHRVFRDANLFVDKVLTENASVLQKHHLNENI